MGRWRLDTGHADPLSCPTPGRHAASSRREHDDERVDFGGGANRRLGLAVCLAASLLGVAHGQAPRATIALDPDDIGGVVTSDRGPEAGVWVIAETTDLPTKFVRIVVTDDQGRYVAARSAEGVLRRLGARLRARRWSTGSGCARQDAEPSSPSPRPIARAAAEYYPAGYWLSLIRVPAKDGVSRHRGQRHRPGHPKPGRVVEKPEVRRVHGVSSARHRRDTRDPEGSRLVRLVAGRVAAADPVGTGGHRHDQRDQPARAASAHAVRRVDRSHRGRRDRRRRRRVRRASNATS